MQELVAKKISPERVANLLRPLAGALPSGVELDHHHEHFRSVGAEIDKLGGMSAAPDWARVLTSGEHCLTHTTKDLRIAAAVARAWWEGKGGAANLVHALTLVDGLVRDRWPDLHPIDAGDRRDALDLFFMWFIERWSDEALNFPEPTRVALAPALTHLCDLVGERLGDPSPDLEACQAIAAALTASLPRSEPPQTPPADDAPEAHAPEVHAPEVHAPAEDRVAATVGPSVATTATTTRTPAAWPPAPPPASPLAPFTAPDAPTSPDAAIALLRAMRERLVDAVTFLRRATPTAPLAYRLLRQVVWQHLDELDLSADKLPFRPPPRRDLEAIERLHRAQQWSELLDHCEVYLDLHPLWLDLQRHAVNALTQLGDAHARARRDLEHELRGLLARLPPLPERRFNDGTPLADPATRSFLAELTTAATSNPTATPTDPAGLQAAAARAPSGRERFLLRRALARACLAAGRPDVAAGLLAALCEQARGLADWEPELLGECLSELIACGRTLGSEARARLGIDHAFAELSAQNPPAALLLGRDPADTRA